MHSVVHFHLHTEPAGITTGNRTRDGVKAMLGTVFAAQGGPFELGNRSRSRGVWSYNCLGTIPQGARAGIITALEATGNVTAGSCTITDES